MRVENGNIRLRTRRGLDWTDRFPEIAEAGAELPDCLIDGEICALNGKGATDFGALQAALSDERTHALVYFVFDCLFDGGEDMRPAPLDARKKALRQILTRNRDAKRICFLPHFASPGEAVLSAACKMELEGVISKDRTAPYSSGRGCSWTKSKCRPGQEVVIGGWRGTLRKLRSLLVGTFHSGKLVYLGRVGTGYGGTLAADLLTRLKPIRRPTSPFIGPLRGSDLNWVEPELVAEIEYENMTSDGLLRQAAFKGLRLDKSARSVVTEIPSKKLKKNSP